jgi:hypothetical protein
MHMFSDSILCCNDTSLYCLLSCIFFLADKISSRLAFVLHVTMTTPGLRDLVSLRSTLNGRKTRRFFKHSWFNSLVRRIRWRWTILNINCKFEYSGWVVKIKLHTQAVGIILFCGKCGCWLIFSVYILMSFDFPFVRLFGVR